MVALGDSWAAGTGADTPADGFLELTARHFGWRLTVVPNGAGTGYGNPASSGTYAQRLLLMLTDPAVRLVIMQGGINDRATSYEPGMMRAFAVAAEKYPHAQTLVVGIAPPIEPVDPGYVRLNNTLAALARNRHDAFIDPITEGWLAGRTTGPLIHHTGPDENHPTTSGHAVLARLLVRDVMRLGG